MDAHAFQLTRRRAAEEAEAGAPPARCRRCSSYYATELNKRRYEMLLEAEGFQGLGWEGEGFTSDELRLHPRMAALQGQHDRGRDVGSPVEHHRQARAWPAGLARAKRRERRCP